MIGDVEAFLRRVRGAPSIEDERESLRHAREVAAAQLEAMKRELAERVHAIRERERELADALAQTGGPIIRRQANEPASIEPPGPQPVPGRREIEQRLAELRTAEQLFLRTQTELAQRSEAIAARERLVDRRERALNSGHPTPAEVAVPPRRLERHEPTSPAGDTGSGFAEGLESLRRRGTRRTTRR